MDKVLIHTDVILDLLLDRNPFSDDAANLLSLCEFKRIQGFVTPIIISKVYCILRQTAKHEKVIESLLQLMTIVDVLTIEKATILQALGSEFTDFEDALQNYAAETDSNVTIIITRNIKDYKKSTLGVMTPENFLKTGVTDI